MYSMNKKSCGVEKTLKIIGAKWTILIIRDLCDGVRRFGQLRRSLDGISPRTLALRLKQLEKEGIVKRKVFQEIPLHVEYSLTGKGASLREIVIKMREWGQAAAKNLRVKGESREITSRVKIESSKAEGM
ncbi:transcriptional regulator [Candidatus Beckwithbacteria bacterium CG22_combo_CG10-13_8_21_14_all_01_47_9]|uniref:Transcriptional regulator n=3 Tax=Candidatus Beckwithiibacteriota TaxID=1752726 RepID=A0A2H0DZI1_9BACT|nr:MAG: transcriptional regulator [Candidatus Beckwithbacteria bacterium CG22_combo_CG10-13_8_21_14_all_01_47_9]